MFHILQTIHGTYCQIPCSLCVIYKGYVYGISMHDFVSTPSLSFSMIEMPEIQISSNKCCKCKYYQTDFDILELSGSGIAEVIISLNHNIGIF